MSDVPADYVWWLDVETMNSWQRDGAEARARNTAALEGMAQFYAAIGVSDLGLYSTHYQWGQIVGTTLTTPTEASPAVGGNLLGAPSWLAGAADGEQAWFRCSTATGLTGGPVVLQQYIVDDLDHNASCV